MLIWSLLYQRESLGSDGNEHTEGSWVNNYQYTTAASKITYASNRLKKMEICNVEVCKLALNR